MHQPVQSRSRATLERVCEAAMGLLEDAGWDAFNTNAVAARAGVSGPTVYRYFPNKYVLAAELRRQLDEAESRAALPEIAAVMTVDDLPAAARGWVRAMAAARSRRSAGVILRTISGSVPDLQETEARPDLLVTALAEALRRLQPGLTPAAAEEQARAIRISTDALVDDAVRGGRVDEAKVEVAAGVAVSLIRSAVETVESGMIR